MVKKTGPDRAHVGGFKQLTHAQETARLRMEGKLKPQPKQVAKALVPGITFKELPGSGDLVPRPFFTANGGSLKDALQVVAREQPRGTTYLLNTEANTLVPDFNVGYQPEHSRLWLVPKTDQAVNSRRPTTLGATFNTLSNTSGLMVDVSLGSAHLSFSGREGTAEPGLLPLATFEESNPAVAVQKPRDYVNRMRQASVRFGSVVTALAELGEYDKPIMLAVEPSGRTRVYAKGTTQEAAERMMALSKLVDGPLTVVHDLLKGRFQDGKPIPNS